MMSPENTNSNANYNVQPNVYLSAI